MGANEDEVAYDLNTDFDIARLAPQDVAQVIASWQSNAITFEEMRDNLKRGGIAYMNDEEAKTEMEGAGIDLAVPVGSAASAAAAAADAKAKADAEALKQKNNQPPGKPPVK